MYSDAFDTRRSPWAAALLSRSLMSQHSKPTDEQLVNRYCYHAPVGDQPARYCKVRNAVIEAAKVIRDVTPCSPEQTRAFNALDEAMMLANAAIARNEGSPVVPPAGTCDNTAPANRPLYYRSDMDGHDPTRDPAGDRDRRGEDQYPGVHGDANNPGFSG